MPRLLELFCGTGSVGKVFRQNGWEVFSVDLDSRRDADLHVDVAKFDYKSFLPNHFQCVWASPPCTHYSCARSRAKTPRDLEGSDELVRCTLAIIAYFSPCAWWMENPHTGLLKSRDVVSNLPYQIVDYCMYGTSYRKRTALWGNVPANLKLCNKACIGWAEDTCTHKKTAQRGPRRIKGAMMTVADRFTIDELYALPYLLVEEIERATILWLNERQN